MLSIQELRSSTQKELLQELSKTQGELLKIRISVKTKHEKDASKVGKVKRYVAQLKTVLTELDKEESMKAVTPAKEDKKKSNSAKAMSDSEKVEATS